MNQIVAQVRVGRRDGIAAQPVLHRAFLASTALVGIALRVEARPSVLQLHASAAVLGARWMRQLTLAIEPAAALLARIGGLARKARRAGPVARLRRRWLRVATAAAALAGGTMIAAPAQAQYSASNPGEFDAAVASSNALNGGIIIIGQSFNVTNPIATTAPLTINLQGRTLGVTGFGAPAGTVGITGNGATSILNLTGTNTFGNLSGTSSVIAFDGNAALGSGTTIGLSSETFRALADVTVTKNITLGGQGATFDTNGRTMAISGAISGGTASPLIASGGGTLALSGANTYTGATNIIGTTLRADAAGVISSSSPVNITSTGTFDLNGFNQSIASLAGEAGTTVTLGTATLTTGTAGTIYSGAINGSGNLVVQGGGNTQRLAGTNGYTGTTTVRDTASGFAVLRIDGSILGSQTITIESQNSSAILDVGNSTAIANTAVVTLSGAAAPELRLQQSTEIGSLNSASTGALVSFASGAVLTTGRNGTADTFAGNIGFGGNGALVKAGTGTFTLTGASGYTGATTISAGTLQIGNGGTSGSLASGSAVSVAGGATLALNRTGTLAFGNNVSGAGAVSVVGGTAAGDLITLSGALTQTGGLTVANASNVTIAASGSYIAAAGGITLNGGTFTNQGTVQTSGENAVTTSTTVGTTVSNAAGAQIVGQGSGVLQIVSNVPGALTVSNAGLIQGVQYDGVTQHGTGALSVINAGTGVIYGQNAIGSANGYGVGSDGTGILTLINAAGGRIVGQYGAVGSNAADTITNSGTIASGSYDTTSGTVTPGGIAGIQLRAGGTITNGSTAFTSAQNAASVIEGATAINATGGNLRLDNSGVVSGQIGTSDGVGLTIVNRAGATITSGDFDATYPNNAAVSIVNAGTIRAGTGAGTGFSAVGNQGTSTGTITNAATGVLRGGSSAIYNGEFTNAVQFGGASLTFNNYGQATTDSGGNAFYGAGNGAATINLFAGSTTGNIQTGGGDDTLSLYTGVVGAAAVTVADPILGGANTITVRAAGDYAAASVGTINLGGGTNTLNLRGTGDGTQANGAAGALDMANVSGLSTLSKQDSGTFVLTGSYAGSVTTTISGGTLVVAGASALGSNPGEATVANGANLTIANVAIGAEAVTLNGGAALTGTGTASLAGTVTLNATSTVTTAATGDALTLSGAVGGAGGLTKAGAGTLTLSGNNTYTGTTTIDAGTLELRNGNAIADTNAVVLGSTGGTLRVTNSEFIGTLSGGGANAGTVAIAAGASLGISGANASANYTGAINGGGALSVSRFTGGNVQTFGGTISGLSGFTVADASTVTIAATGSYTGGPAITTNGGTFNVLGSVVTTGTENGITGSNGGTFTVGATGTVSGGANGISAGTGGATNLTITSAGTIAGGTGAGIRTVQSGGFLPVPLFGPVFLLEFPPLIALAEDGSTGTTTIAQTGGSIAAGGNGIDATSAGGAITVTQSGGTIGTAMAGVGGIGIRATNGATTGTISVTAGSVYAQGAGIDAGITNAGNAGTVGVTLSDGAMVMGGTTGAKAVGIRAVTMGTGSASITAGNGVTVVGDQPGAITTTMGGDATQTFGNNATVTGTSGIVVEQQAAGGAGVASITVGTGGTITATGIDPTDPYLGNGLFAGNQGTGATTVTTGAGTTVTGSGNGIYAAQTNAASAAALTITTGGAVTGQGGTVILPAAYPAYPNGTAGTTGTSGAGIAAVNAGTGNITVTANGPVTGTAVGIVAQATGTGGVTINGSGSVTATGGTGIIAQAAAGAITIAQGGAVMGNGGAGIVVSSPNAGNTVAVSSTVSGSTIGLLAAGGGTTTLSGAGTVTGPTALQVQGAGSTLVIGDAFTGTLSGTPGTLAVGTGSTLNINRNADLALSNPITGVPTLNNGAVTYPTGTLTKTGTGLLTLTGSNGAAGQFTGAFTINQGAVSVNGVFGDTSQPPATLTTAVTVANGATLGGNGTVAANVTVAGTLAPGIVTNPRTATVGTLAIGGNLTLNAGSTSAFDLSSPNVVGGGNDLVSVGGDLMVNGGTLALANAPTSGLYRLFNVGGAVTSAGAANAGFTAVTATNGTAAVYTIPAAGTPGPSQVNARIALGGQIVQYWDGTDLTGVQPGTGGTAGARGGPGTWNAGNTNWTDDPVAGQVNQNWQGGFGVFTTVGGTVTVVGQQNLQGLQFAADGYTLVAGANGSLNLTADPNAEPGFANYATLRVDAGLSATIGTPITGVGLNKRVGAGTLVLTGANTFQALNIADGVVEVRGGAAILDAAPVTIENVAGARLLVTNTETIGSLAGGGTLGGSVGILAGQTLVTGGNNTSTTFAGTIDGGMAGTVTLIKDGTGTFTLSGSNTFAGITENRGAGGTLVVAAGGSLASDVQNDAGATFVNNGTVGGSHTNAGTSTNNGLIAGNVGNTGTFTNNGTVGGRLTNSGTASNAGTINGGVTNSGTFGNTGTVNNGLTNTAGTTNNAGTINGGAAVAAGSTLTTTGVVNGGITNAGTVNARGQANGPVTNTGQFTVTGPLTGIGRLTNNGTVDLGGNDLTIGSLVGTTAAATITNGGTLSTGIDGTSSDYAGGINGANTGLIKQGGGTFSLSGTNGYGGATAIRGGTLAVAPTGRITGSAAIVNDTTFTIAAGGQVTTTGVLTNNGTLVTAGTLTANGAIANAGTATVTGGTVTTPTLTNTGTLNQSGGTINATNSLTNGGTLNQSAGTLNTATATNSGSFTSAAAVNATTSFTNSGTQSQTGGTINTPSYTNTASGSFTQSAGTLATTNIATNGRFASAGTVTATNALTNTGTQTQSGGVINAGTFTNAASGTYANTGGALNTGTTRNDGRFTAAGPVAATVSFTNTGLLSATGTITTPTFVNAGTVNGLLNLAGVAQITNQARALINDGLSVQTAAGGARLDNAGMIGTGGLVINTAAGTLNAFNASGGTFFGSVSSAAGTTSTFTNTAGGAWQYQGTGNLAGTDTIVNQGVFTVTPAGGTLNGLELFDNQAGGQVVLNGALNGPIGRFENAGTVTLATDNSILGIGTFNNAGSVAVGANAYGSTIGAGTFNNLASGRVSLQNGLVTDSLTFGGNYVGTAGSRLAIDIDLSRTDAGMRADVFRIAGANTGSSFLSLNILPGTRRFFSAPIPVVQTAGGGTGQLQIDPATPLPTTGFIGYSLQQTPGSPGSYQIVSQVNAGQAAAAASSISGLVTSLNVGFFQSISAFIGGPAEHRICTEDLRKAKLCDQPAETASVGVTSSGRTWAQLNRQAAAAPVAAEANVSGILPDTYGLGLWARGSGGETTINSTSTASFAGITQSGPNRTRIGFAGMQFGGDFAVFNIANTGFNLHMGATGGQIYAQGRELLSSQASGVFDVPFVGAYAAVTSGAFTSDISYRHDFYNARITDPLVQVMQRRLPIGSDTVAGSAGYRIDLPGLFGGDQAYFLEPSGSVSYTQTRIGVLGVTGGALSFAPIDSILGRFGFRAGTTLLAGESLALQPFVTASVWNEFAGNAASRFTASSILADPSAFVPILTNRVGTFGQVGVGITGQLLGTDLIGYVRADFRFGERIDGYSVNGGVRYPF